MAKNYFDTFVVAGEAQAVYRALVEASQRSGNDLIVDQQSWSVQVTKGDNFVTPKRKATSRIVGAQSGQTTIEIDVELPFVLVDSLRLRKKLAESIKEQLFEALAMSNRNPAQPPPPPPPSPMPQR